MVSRTVRMAAAAASVLAAVPATASMKVSSGPTKHVSCSAGTCTATAANAVLNVGQLQTMLASSDVTVAAGSSAQTIEIVKPLAWASTNRLTLDAQISVDIEAKIVVQSTGGLTIVTNDGGSGGDLNFSAHGKIDFWDNASSLIVNGQSFTLVRDIAQLAGAFQADQLGHFAFAADYDAAPDGAYNGYASLGSGSVFEGLGHTISNLNIDGHSASSAGMFGGVNTIRDIHLAHIAVVSGCDAGAIAGRSTSAALVNVTSSGSVASVGSGCSAGGLIGTAQSGVVMNASSSANVTVGFTTYAGGLVGFSSATIAFSHASGKVTANKKSSAGGLVGFSMGLITQSYATGNVVTHARVNAGGLVGATNSESAPVVDSYSMGTVAAGSTSDLGGLMGYGAASVSTSYSTSSVVVHGSRPLAGGFVGSHHAGTLTQNYWDTDTSGQANACSGACSGVTGVSDAALKSGLPSGFNPAVWGQDPAINNGYPYLLNNRPN